MTDRSRFALLKQPRRVWAIGSVHGEAERLKRLHMQIGPKLEPGDRIVYLGNLMGRGPAVAETLDAVLLFRAQLLSRPRAFACDLAFLRGSQEEMWQRLLQLQFAMGPQAVLEWMLDQGLEATLRAYGGTAQEGLRECRAGTLQLTRWTATLRRGMQARPGHAELVSRLRRAALTQGRELLFVHAGLDPARPLDAQGDAFWWGAAGFLALVGPYQGFRRVVRGFAPKHPGLELGEFTATVDGGCGWGGPLLAACFLADGSLADQLEA